MSEEEVVNRFLNMITTEYVNNLARQFQNQYILRYKEIEQLQQENKQLKETIDKALKMISNEKYLHIERLEKIKDILGEKENE